MDKVTGKGLSTEDYTSTEKTKLSGIESGANNYVHPTAKQCTHTHASTEVSDDNSDYPHVILSPSTPNTVHQTFISFDSAIGDLQDLIGDAIQYINQ